MKRRCPGCAADALCEANSEPRYLLGELTSLGLILLATLAIARLQLRGLLPGPDFLSTLFLLVASLCHWRSFPAV